MWWRKKKPKPEPKVYTATFAATDNCHARAEKIWYLIGMGNDRFGAIPEIAGYLAAYRELDQKANYK